MGFLSDIFIVSYFILIASASIEGDTTKRGLGGKVNFHDFLFTLGKY